MCTACCASWQHFLYITGNDGVKPGILILSPVVTARMGSFYNGLKNVSKGLRDVKEFKEELVLEKQANGDWAWRNQTLQVRLNRRVTFDRQIEVPSLVFFFFFFKPEMKKKNRFADGLAELANRGFGFSMDAFLKSVEMFLDKEIRTIPFNSHSLSPPYPSHLLCFVSRC